MPEENMIPESGAENTPEASSSWDNYQEPQGETEVQINEQSTGDVKTEVAQNQAANEVVNNDQNVESATPQAVTIKPEEHESLKTELEALRAQHEQTRQIAEFYQKQFNEKFQTEEE